MNHPEAADHNARTMNSAMGDSVGAVVQAAAIHGDINLYSSGPNVRDIPNQLIAPPRNFVGRRSELSALHRMRRGSGSAVLVLSGQGGVGKTALARQWAHDIRHDFVDGQLCADLDGFSESEPLDPGEALGSFLRALGLPPSRVPGTLAEQAALYRTWTADRSLLVVLDNARSVAQVRVLLPAGNDTVVVVTSRLRLGGLVADGATFLDVGPLTADESVNLLAESAGPVRVDQERDQAQAIARLCGGLPIALTVVAARLVTRPLLTLSRLAEDLKIDTARLGGLHMGDGPSVQSSFDLSYRGLDPRFAALYRRLAAHPGKEFGLGPIRAVLSSIDGLARDPDPEASVSVLLEASLLQEIAENRFRFHDLLLLHARQQLKREETPAVQEEILRRQLEWYLAAARKVGNNITPYRVLLPYDAVTDVTEGLPSCADRDDSLAWLERERVNLIAAANEALGRGWAELAWHLSDAMWPLLLYRKHYHDRRGLDELGVEAARRWGNARAEAEMLKRLGRTCTTMGDHEDAERYLGMAISRWAEVNDARGLVDARETMAALLRDTGRISEAIEMYQTALAANRDLGADRHAGMTLISLGALLPEAGRADDAVGLLREAQQIFHRLATVDPYNGVRVEIALAAAYLAAGDMANAEAAARRGADGMRRLGSGYEQAQATEILAQVAQRGGDDATARGYWTAALRIYEALGSPRAATLRAQLPPMPGGGDPPVVQGAGDAVP